MKRLLCVSLSFALLIAAMGCERQPTSDGGRPDDVTVQLKWVHQAQFSGMYVAQEKGAYAREGLRVHFLEGGAGIDNVEALTSGRAEFAITTPEDALMSRSRGIPLKAIAAIYRRSAVVFLAHGESAITRPRDLLGKTVAAGNTGGANRDLELQFVAMIKKLGLSLSQITLVDYDPKYTGFLEGDVDVTAAFSTGGLILLRQKGLTLNLIWPSDYGIHFYSDSVVTTDDLIREKPELITRFLRATLEGWREAVGNPQEAVAATLKYARVKDPQFQTSMMDGLLPLVHTGEDQIGWMKPSVWEGMVAILLEQNILKSPFNADEAYSLRFLEGIYGGSTK